jgi:hypothetical protein
MTILFAGGELGSFTPSDNTVIETTSASFGGVDFSYARCGITVPAGPSYALSAPWAATNSIWCHFNVGQLIAVGSAPFFEVYAGGVPIFQIQVASTGVYTLLYWNGAAFVQVGAGFKLPFASTQTFDVQLSATSIFVYVAGTVKDGATGAFADVTAMTQLSFLPLNDYMVFSECIVADQPTLGYRLRTMPVTGAGNTNNWTGGFGNINEIVTNDGSFISTPTAAEVALFAQSTNTVNSVRAIAVTARATTTAGAPQHLELACESGGTTNFSASLLQTGAFGPNVGIFPTDPNTGSAWTNAAANLMQYGVKSIA